MISSTSKEDIAAGENRECVLHNTVHQSQIEKTLVS